MEDRYLRKSAFGWSPESFGAAVRLSFASIRGFFVLCGYSLFA